MIDSTRTVAGSALRLNELGEKRAVRSILSILEPSSLLVGGLGSDAAAIDIGSDRDYLLVCIDRSPTPLAYKMSSQNMAAWGDLAITCVASDVLASGGYPIAFVTSLILPSDTAGEDVIDIMQHAQRASADLDASIVGGDTKEGSSCRLTTAAIGLCPKNQLVRRTGARAGDVVVITGELGTFTAAELAWRNGDDWQRLDQNKYDCVFRPRPAFKVARLLLASITPRAGMDLSDGLLSTAFGLAEANNLGVEIDEGAIPIAQEALSIASRFSVDPMRLALGTGDWQIAFAVDGDEWKRLPDDGEVKRRVRAIGRMTDKSGVRLNRTDSSTRSFRRIEQESFVKASADQQFLDVLLKDPLFEE